MPTYEYACDACQHHFELYQSITASAKRTCPACGRRKLRRLIGPGAAIVFKGSGFHQTDYRSESYRKGAAAEAKPAAGGADGKAAEGGAKAKAKAAAKGDSPGK